MSDSYIAFRKLKNALDHSFENHEHFFSAGLCIVSFYSFLLLPFCHSPNLKGFSFLLEDSVVTFYPYRRGIMKKHYVYLLIGIAALVLDQVSKYMIETTLSLGESLSIIPGFFQLLYVRNTGGAWSMFAGTNMTVFYVITIVELVILFLFYRSCEEKDRWNRSALVLMMAGAIGNFIDRLSFQYVRDFLSFNIFGYDFPVFNIADCALCIGVFIIVGKILLEEFGVIRK